MYLQVIWTRRKTSLNMLITRVEVVFSYLPYFFLYLLFFSFKWPAKNSSKIHLYFNVLFVSSSLPLFYWRKVKTLFLRWKSYPNALNVNIDASKMCSQKQYDTSKLSPFWNLKWKTPKSGVFGYCSSCQNNWSLQ